MTYFKIGLGILLCLASSRLIPHPPNFTSLLALSFYIPAILGTRFIPLVFASLLITDLIIGFHSLMLFTYGSVIIIGIISKYLSWSFSFRIIGAILGSIIFFIITNFGVWLGGSYEYNFEGLVLCYTLAIPFFTSSIFSTLIFSILIEFVLILYKQQLKKKLNN